MTQHADPANGADPVLAKNCTVDAVVAVVLFIVGAVVAQQSYRLGSGWTSDGPGAGYFPFYVGLIMCIASLGVLWQSLSKKTRDEDAFVHREAFGRVVKVFVPALVYVLGIWVLGIYVASVLYIAFFMVWLGKYPLLKSLLVALAVNVVFYLMFETWFKVPLYRGLLDPLRFL